MTPTPHQMEAAAFLEPRRRAFLWSEPRTGKTGAAILAADRIGAKKILVVTTASGRGVWRRAFPDWSKIDRRVLVLGVDEARETDVAIIGYGGLHLYPLSTAKRPDLVILDEDHYLANPFAKRTERAYGRFLEDGRDYIPCGIVQPADRVWHLTGSPMPHDLGNTWARMRISCPERLGHGFSDTGDVTEFTKFQNRYCVVKSMKPSRNAREHIRVVFGGRNEGELKQRLSGMYLRRTAQECGIDPPRYDMLPLSLPRTNRAGLDDVGGRQLMARVAKAIDEDGVADLDMELATLRRVTATLKAPVIADYATEQLTYGELDKLVIAYWHVSVGDLLQDRLRKFGCVRVDGSTSPKGRDICETEFRKPGNRVFLAQMQAASEAIDLSPARELWFAETCFSPKIMDQMSKRITNMGAKRSCFVKVCVLENSIDEVIQMCVIRLWSSINAVLKERY